MEVEQQLVDSLTKQSPLVTKHPRKQWNTQRGEAMFPARRPQEEQSII